MIALDGVSYRYPGGARPALRDVTLRVSDGDVVGVAGANGAGKSTLCLVAAGLAPRVVGGELGGAVTLEGRSAATLATHELPARVAIAFQDPATQLSGIATTVYEEVAFGPSNLGVPLDELIARVESALEALGIAELAARHPARLSGGQQQLVALAALLAMRPRHLVLDEPTARLDAQGVRMVADAIQRLAADGMGILVVEQRSELLAAVCGRVGVLEAGSVVLHGPAAEVLADARLPALGVAEPASVRLARLARDAGLSPRTVTTLAAAAEPAR